MTELHYNSRLQRLRSAWFNGWTIGVLSLTFVLSTPILAVLSGIFVNTGEVWQHLQETVLTSYILNSLALMGLVGLGVTLVGTGTAWLVTMCRFPGSRLLEWALLLPLAAPAYILAYTYTELLEFYGPIQSSLRHLFGWERASDYWFPHVRSLGGAALMLILVLYPYVYLLVRSAFLNQSTVTLEASRSLGCGPWRSFWQVALPLARPAIVAGTSLALMETLNDYGTVQYFAVDTFTTGIYRTWFNMGERIAACQLAACLMAFVFAIIWLELWSRGQSRYYQTVSQYQAINPYSLQGWRSIVALGACLLPIILGLLVPGGVLVNLMLAPGTPATDSNDDFASATNPNEHFWEFAGHSLLLAGITAALGVAIAVIVAYGVRLRPNWLMKLSAQITSLGYAVPGSVIAVGILVPLGSFDNTLDAWMRSTFGISTGLLLSGTIVALVFAYLVRFLAVSLGSVQTALLKIKPSMDDAARSLGYSTLSTLSKIHLPLIRSGLLTAAVLVFVDVMKELPATLIVRPFNFDTLAVRVYNLASDERLAEAAAPALAIVLVGLVPVILLSRQITASRKQLNGTE